jgi:hypothetical protein
MDMDSAGNMVFAGGSEDTTIITPLTTSYANYPIIAYTGNTREYEWAK